MLLNIMNLSNQKSMKNLIIKSKFLFLIIIFFLFSSNIFSKELSIKGNKFSDDEVIESIIGQIPAIDDRSQSDFILKQLNKSGLFKDIEISYDQIFFYINVVEYPSINKIYYKNNDRIKDSEIDSIAKDLNVNTLSEKVLNNFVDELTKIYKSFGFNNIKILVETTNLENNTADLSLIFNEGKITKIKKINFKGNTNFDNSLLHSKIQSKTKKITNIFANNNFKLFQINNDSIFIKNFYISNGYKDVNVTFDVEYFRDNRVIVNFNINEGLQYFVSSIKINDLIKIDKSAIDEIDIILNKINIKQKNIYNLDKINEIEYNIANILETYGFQFFQIKIFEKITNNTIDVLFEILKTEPIYINQINIYGNTRTFDYVIRRELNISEGDPLNNSRIKEAKKNLNQLFIFKNVDVNKKIINVDQQNLDIEVEESQTGSFNVGLSVGSLDGLSLLTGLKEKNINGSGRSLDFLINTSEDNKAFTLSTSEKFVFNNKVNQKFSGNYKENDYSKSKSYKLNTLNFDTDFLYQLSDNFHHTVGLGYQLKNYKVTNSSTVSDSVANSSGDSISFNFKNELSFNTLNSYIKPSRGNFVNFSNYIQTPSSSSNGYIKNLFTLKKYLEKNKDIYSIQTKFGNIYSLNNSEILTDDKFSLGGRWLRGFDTFGAGPRNSRTAYVGGNNLITTKIDFSKPLTFNEQNPIYLNIFNDYGLVWGNKNTVSLSDQKIRASYGFGINYYSAIGPIGFTWGFPLSDKEYDIKRMFMFTIGNLN